MKKSLFFVMNSCTFLYTELIIELNRALVCLLLHLLLCQNVDSERLGEDSQLPLHHKHRRRSEKYDPRLLGFHFETEPENAIVSENKPAIFNCKYHLKSELSQVSDESEAIQLDARIEWRKDGNPINQIRSGVGRITNLSNGSLVVDNPVTSDEGIYQCAVVLTLNNYPSNSISLTQGAQWVYLSRRATLSLASLQRFEHQPINQKVFVSQFVAFRCLLYSKPAAQIEWYKNNRRIEDGEEGVKFLPISKTLEIGNASSSHTGSYKCVARNGAKSRTSQIATLEVVQGSSDIGAISLVLEPRSQVIRVKDSFVLECLVNGFPKPRIRWLHDSTQITADVGEARIEFVGMDKTSLLIRNSTLADAGVYTCRAENGDDSVDSSATIVIRSPPTFTTVPKDEITQETSDAEFECVAEAFPKPRITWFKNGEVIVPSEYFVIGSNKLKIFGLVKDDQGVYQCLADNEVGSAQTQAQLIVDAAEILSPYYALSATNDYAAQSIPTVSIPIYSTLITSSDDDNSTTHLALTAGGVAETSQSVPLQPLGLEVVEVNSRSASLKWDPPLSQDKGSVRLYHVFCREEDSTRERTLNSTSTFATLANLQPNSVYVVRVVASNQAGLGQSSEEIRLTTKQGELVPGKVRNLRAEVLGSETIVVEWDPPAVTSSPEALRYKLFYIKTNSSDDEKETQVLMVKTSYTLHGMDKNTRYRIRVEAEGQNGAGPSSDQLEVQTFSDVPSAPPQQIRLEATEHRTVLVRWSPPAIEHRNGVITGYKIRYKTKRRGAKGSVAVVDGDPGHYSIENLEAGAHYTVRIAAVTQNGTGTFSDWFGVDTPMEEREEAQIAGAPSELRVHAAYDSIQVAWLPPRDDNVMVRGYLIGWGINIPDVEKATVNSDIREYIIKGLKPNREYVISLRAFNNIGNGFPIYETVKTTAYGPSSHQSFFGSLPSAKTPHLSQMSTPVGVSAESISSTAIRLSWTDPNEGFNQYYTIRYSSNSDNNGQVRQLNTSETEHIVDGLRPNTQYEFSVKLVESQQWSMSAVNKTFPAPPSSAPRDLSILPQSVEEHDDPNTIMLSWQPPKYGNGEIEEYIVLYSDRLDLPDKDWIMDSVKGDRLSMLIKNLLPKAIYYFKIQARNVKGYGPFSPVATYTPENGVNPFGEFESGNGWPKMDGGRKGWTAQIGQLLTRNLIYVLIGVVSIVLLLLIVILTVVCVQRKKTSTNGTEQRRRSQQQYTQGRKSSKNNQPDLWIQQNGRFAALNAGGISTDFMETPAASDLHDLKRFGSNTGAVESPPRYQTLQEKNIMSQSQTSYLSECAYASNRVTGRPSPLNRNCQQRKSLPPRISSSLTSTSPYAHSLAGGNHRQRVVTIHSPKSNTTHKQLREPSNTSSESDQLAKSSSFQGVGIPTIPLVSSAKRIPTANLKTVGVGGGMLKGGFAKSQKSSLAPKAVNFSPDIEGYIDEEAGALGGVEKLARRDLESTCHSDGECNGTLARSYHQSSTSLEAQRQRTPQVLYTGVNRQPITKVDFASSDHGSYNGGSTTALPHTPPPHPTADPYQSSSQLHDGYQTVRGLNPLKSFAQMGGAPPPGMVGSNSPLLAGPSNGEQRTAQIVRPVVFASPTLRNSMAANRPAGIVIGQKSNLAGGHKLPVGRATAQPRVNVSNVVYSPYSTVRVAPDNMDNITNGQHVNTDNDDKGKFDGPEELKPLRAAASTEEINVHEIDHMIDTLQQLQQEFTER